MRRRAWPTMALTCFALLAVLGVLLVTGSRTGRTEFVLSVSPDTASVSSGGQAQFRLEVSAGGKFRGAVVLSTNVLPAGVLAGFDTPTVTLSPEQPRASVLLTLSVSSQAPAGPLGVAVTASNRAGIATQSLMLQIDRPSITDAGPPPPARSGPVAIAGLVAAAGLGGRLQPGVAVPVIVRLANHNTSGRLVRRLVLTVVPGRASCRAADFFIVQYRWHYPLPLAAGQARTLSQLAVPPNRLPRIMLRPAAARACAGAPVQLQALATG